MTPFLGASVYVWASVLSVTLLGLAIGYRLGDKMSQKSPQLFIFINLLASGVFIFCSTIIAKVILPLTLSLEIRIASIIGGIALLFIPMILLGTVSPILVNLHNKISTNTAKSTGIIYGIGTFSGILFLLITMYSLLPQIGIQNITFLLGISLVIVGLLFKMLYKHE